MELIRLPQKIRKAKCYKRIPNVHGIHIEIYGASKYVGFFVVNKELKEDYKGYLGRCTHAEYKLGALSMLTPAKIEAMLQKGLLADEQY